MASTEAAQNETLSLIQNTYVPFLKKLIAHLEKKKTDTQPKAYEKLKYVYKTFCEADSREKIEVYEACKDMLERWHKRYKAMRSGSDKKSVEDANQSEESQSETPSDAKKTSNKSNSEKEQGSSKKNARQSSVLFQDEIEIESSDSSNAPPASGNSSEKWTPIANIKKEKNPVDTPAASNNVPSPARAPTPEPEKPKEIVFICASCQFRTTDEADFMKHARTDHRTDLSLWCKQCGKCFSNAGVLVSHIKEANCEKEEMIYRCGVKDCTFETPSGQTFVHHLRHCHKGSPFIFCIHCQKIFTLPHCLILHMQNECPFKDKNRKNPGAVSSTPAVQTPAAAPSTPKPAAVSTPKLTPKPVVPSPTPPALLNASAGKKRVSIGRGRARGRGGRGSRTRFTDSSDSDDPDDPMWKPDESLTNQPVRRSARYAKKVIEAKEPELDSDSSAEKQKKQERPSKTIFYCPCCDFSASFKSLLDDHYVTEHKHAKKNSCNVCNVKFESKQLFLEHFSNHEKEKLEGKKTTPPPESEEQPAQANVAASVPVEIVSQPNTASLAPINRPVIIPYQTAIQEKLQKESKLKSFEDLKSANDIQKMKTETKLQHFFKCVVYNCAFTTDDKVFYLNHLSEHHKGKKLHCAYCLDEYGDAQGLTDHMMKDHGRRCYQCSLCFYRGSSKPHVQIHIKNAHSGEKATVFQSVQHLPPDYKFEKEKEEETDLTTTYPYVCAIGDCIFKTYDPKEFKRHNDITHRSVSVFFCFYCKVDFISFKRLMSHYHLHGINNFQCTYCVHGSDTKEEILVHLCNSHADKPFKVHVRTPMDSNSTAKTNDSCADKDSNSVDVSAAVDVTNVSNSLNSIPLAVKDKNVYKDSTFPMEIPCLGKDVFCKLGFCGELLDDMNAYVKHLTEEHSALNFLCPYCSFAADKMSEFQNHLVCHGPYLFACGEENCLYYSHKESDVGLHMINTSHHKGASPKTLRKKADSAPPKPLIDEEALGLQETSSATGFVCPFCSFKCSKKATMKNHLYVELVYKRFLCNLCKIKCHSRHEAKQHFRNNHSHHNIKCAIDSNAEVECFVEYYLSSKVQRVTVKGLSIEKENWLLKSGLPASKCANCSLSLPVTVELHHHMVSCLSHDYQPYICNHCGAKTTDLIRMKCHTSEVHPGGVIKYAVFPNKLLEEQHGRKLQDLRLTYLKELVLSVIDKTSVGEPKLIPKHYKCAYCKFVDNFRSNIEKHCVGCHKNKPVTVEKIKGNNTQVSTSNSAEVNSDSSQDSVGSNDSSSSKEHYLCVYCTKKMFTLLELDQHIASHHAMPDEGVYPFIYCPDSDRQFSAEDSELYECAYCSVSQENLYHLQRHCKNLHSAAAFHVRGHRAKNGAMLKCDVCDTKVVTQEQLTKHYQFNHPTKAPPNKRKLANSKSGSPAAKRANKSLPEMYHCSYCKEKSDMILKITAHCESAHPNLPVKYKTTTVKDGPSTSTASQAVEDSDVSMSDEECASGSNEKPKSIDLSTITVHLKDKGDLDAKLPVVHFAKLFPLFPNVVVKDFKKSGTKPV